MADDPLKHQGSGVRPRSVRNGERRAVDRHRSPALVDVRDLSSGARRSGRITDLNSGGFCVDTLDPFPGGTLVHVRITGDNGVFESRGRVVGSHMGFWMNIAFIGMTSEHLSVLEAWLAELDAAIHPAF